MAVGESPATSGGSYPPPSLTSPFAIITMPESVESVVEDWLRQSGSTDGYPKILDLVDEEPGLAWDAILEILRRELTEDQTSLLAAGALEDLLAVHGEQFIERTEREAERNPRFNHLLGGVWQNRMSEEIWQRVQKARRNVW